MLKAFLKSTFNMIFWGSKPSSRVACLTAWTEASTPPMVATPTCKEPKKDLASSAEAKQQHLETSHRKDSPMAIGRRPPPFLLRAMRGAPERKGAISRGAFPATTQLTSVVRDSKDSPDTNVLGHSTISLKYWGLKPEPPAPKSTWKVRSLPLTTSDVKTKSGGGGSSGRTGVGQWDASPSWSQ